jgi:hypothetical protein
VKVISEGRVPEAQRWSYAFTCECEARLEISWEDLVRRYWIGTHFRHDYLAARCPLCGHFNQVMGVPSPVAALVTGESTFDGTDNS